MGNILKTDKQISFPYRKNNVVFIYKSKNSPAIKYAFEH